MKIHKNGDSIPKHNYTGHDYNLQLREAQAEFIKLDGNSVGDEEGGVIEIRD